MLLGDIINEFHQRYGLAYAGAAEQADFTALGNRHDQINDLDTRFQQFGGRRLLFIRRWSAMNRQTDFSTDIPGIVDRIAEHIHDPAQRLLANGHSNRPTGVGHVHATLKAFRRAHCNGANDAITQLLLNLKRDFRVIDYQRVINFGDLARRELYVHDSANYLHSCSGTHTRSSNLYERLYRP